MRRHVASAARAQAARAAGRASSGMSAGASAPSGAMVSLNGHLVVKWSPEQIRHLIFAFLSSSFFLSSSPLSSVDAFQLACGRKRMFSATDTVSVCGPAGLPFSWPNFAHDLRSATRGLTTCLITVFLMRRVVLTFLPSSFMRYDTIVSVPSLFLVTCCCGSARSFSSSSSAQSVRLPLSVSCSDRDRGGLTLLLETWLLCVWCGSGSVVVWVGRSSFVLLRFKDGVACGAATNVRYNH